MVSVAEDPAPRKRFPVEVEEDLAPAGIRLPPGFRIGDVVRVRYELRRAHWVDSDRKSYRYWVRDPIGYAEGGEERQVFLVGLVTLQSGRYVPAYRSRFSPEEDEQARLERLASHRAVQVREHLRSRIFLVSTSDLIYGGKTLGEIFAS